MSEYKPQFRPIYHFGHRSLVERISDACYDAFRGRSLDEMADSVMVVTANDTKTIIHTLDKNKAYAGALVAAVGLSALANYIEAKDADISGYAANAIETRSLVAEIATHAIVSGAAFIGISKYEGKSWKEMFTELLKILSVSLPVSLLLYPPARNGLADILMEKDVVPEQATLWSQIILTPAYYSTVIFLKGELSQLARYSAGAYDYAKNKCDGLYHDTKIVHKITSHQVDKKNACKSLDSKIDNIMDEAS